jgi:hypothetical protein
VARGDVFALAKIAGHSSITITQKYVHPRRGEIGEVFSRFEDRRISVRETGRAKIGHSQKKAAKRLAVGIAQKLNCKRMFGADERSLTADLLITICEARRKVLINMRNRA